MYYLVDSDNKYVHINQNALDTCCFLGIIDDEPNAFDRDSIKYFMVQSEIKRKIEDMIKNNYYIFMLGLNTPFEMTCAETICLLKNEHPDIRLYCIDNGSDSSQNVSDNFLNRRSQILERVDKVICLYNELEGDYILNCDKFLIENSSKLLTIDCYSESTEKILDYARTKRLHIEFVRI